MLIEVAK